MIDESESEEHQPASASSLALMADDDADTAAKHFDMVRGIHDCAFHFWISLSFRNSERWRWWW